MRLAILSALAEPSGPAGGGATERPAFRRFAGKSVLTHQIDCAAHLECGRVICVATGAGPELSSARTYAERSGMRFDVVGSNLQLASQITADDDVVLIADGVLPDRGALVKALASRPGVIAFPADPALTLGFERLDADRAWSGALRMRGAGVAKLADLPADCDLSSSLLRIALQSGVAIADLDAGPVTAKAWQRRVDRNSTSDAELHWIARQIQPAPFTAPGLALSERVALRWVRDAGGGKWSRAPHIVALLAGVLAIAAAFGFWPLAGLAMLLAASISLSIASVFDRVEDLGAPPRTAVPTVRPGALLLDSAMIVILAKLIDAQPAWISAMLPASMVGLLMLVAVLAPHPVRAVFGDRIVLLIIMLAAGWFGWTALTVAAVSLTTLGVLLWFAQKQHVRLTTD